MTTAMCGMCMREGRAPLLAVARATATWVAGAAMGIAGAAHAAGPAAPRLGTPMSPTEVARWDTTVFPDGRGLPAGGGTAVAGAPLFAQKCAVCHGAGGRGATAEELAGGTNPLTSASPDKTIGLYWPFATTVFDFTRRAMPMFAPGSLTADEVYALTAYLLFQNGVIGERDEMNATTLPKVRMPNRDGFIGIDAPTR
jgi:S-disulfanyl-L-cysteine oxidoreductase SoxD